MTDTDTLREVLDYCSQTLDIAERFHDAATVMTLMTIIEIIEEGGHNANAFAICDG